jgi:hypothetical protein
MGKHNGIMGIVWDIMDNFWVYVAHCSPMPGVMSFFGNETWQGKFLQ